MTQILNKTIEKLKEEIENFKDEMWKIEQKRQEYEIKRFPNKKFDGEIKYKRRIGKKEVHIELIKMKAKLSQAQEDVDKFEKIIRRFFNNKDNFQFVQMPNGITGKMIIEEDILNLIKEMLENGKC